MEYKMSVICPACSGRKDSRAKLCQPCYSSTGLSRLGTGKYPDLTREGYIHIFRPNHPKADRWGYIKRSIIEWENYHNTPFPDNHHIHHIDNNRSNDTPGNLMAIIPSEHVKITKPWRGRL